MSVVFLSTGEPTVTSEQIQAIASSNNFKIPEQDEKDYLFLLNSLDATLTQVAELPEYVDPRLKPEEGTLPRTWKKAAVNPLNAWACQTDIKSPSPMDPRLAGLTVALKDNVSLAGVPLTGGTFPELITGSSDPHVPTIDAIVVQRLLQSGATVSGTATCENFSMSPLSFTSATGPVHNPWLYGWTTGGSSSGPTALVAIKVVNSWRKRHGLPSVEEELGEGVDAAIGGDQGGSIRIPASYCGVYGLKPTHGLIPYTGIMSLHPLLDHTGPIAGSLEDVARLLNVLAGYDGMDPRMTPLSPLRSQVKDYNLDLENWISAKKEAGEWTPQSSGKGLRIGIIKESLTVLNLSSACKTAFLKAADRFRTIGAHVDEISIPEHTIAPSIWTIATRLGMYHYGFQNNPSPLLNHPLPSISPPPFTQSTYDKLNLVNPAVVNVFLGTQLLTSNPLSRQITAKAICHIHQLIAAYDTALSTYDVLILPSNPNPGSKHPPKSASVAEKMEPSIGATLNTCGFNVTGHPGLVMPVGFAEVGEGRVPVAMQIVGRKFDEARVLRVAKAWEVPGLGLDEWDGR
ncbi:amidase signature enzyme [Venturia nashicola]|uniref:Amidase signature enzyme n=1 Tax=Venturia nashicola TaxID=86259 RepID=A0A4Z1PLV4_9PEZI|nr:amidase signature enzyme [Venturia nashicola]